MRADGGASIEVAMQHSLLSSALALVCLFGTACGAGAGPVARTSSSADEASTSWTAALLRKLDPPLRARVRGGDRDRLAVKVFFRDRPAEDDLADLLLSRVGNQVVGNVGTDTLQRIAAREDVDRIESLRDVGY